MTRTVILREPNGDDWYLIAGVEESGRTIVIARVQMTGTELSRLCERTGLELVDSAA